MTDNPTTADLIAAVEYALDEGAEIAGNISYPTYDRIVVGRAAFADLLANWQAEREALEEALEPFADTGKALGIIEGHGRTEDYEYHMRGLNLTWYDFKHAYALLVQQKAPSPTRKG